MMSSSNTPVRRRTAADTVHDKQAALESSIGLNRAVWWRFSKYEIREGRIAPAPDARLIRYDPHDPGLIDQPHSAIYNMVKGCGFSSHPYVEHHISDEKLTAILQWCGTFGLLGLLPAKLLQLNAWPRWMDQQALGLKFPTYPKTLRTPTGWRDADTFRPDVSSSDAIENSPLTAQHAKKFKTDRIPEFPRVIQYEDGLFTSKLPSEAKLFRYFPGMQPSEADKADYPIVASDEFWRRYGEPIDEFIIAIKQIANIMDLASDFLAGRIEGQHKPEDIGRAFGFLNQYLMGLHPFMTPLKGNEKIRDGLTSYSLLQTIARMIQRNALDGLQPRICPNCSVPFHNRDSRMIYCGRRCQRQSITARQRARMKEKLNGKRADKPKQPKGRNAKQ
jgi:hypothetical protein